MKSQTLHTFTKPDQLGKQLVCADAAQQEQANCVTRQGVTMICSAAVPRQHSGRAQNTSTNPGCYNHHTIQLPPPGTPTWVSIGLQASRLAFTPANPAYCSKASCSIKTFSCSHQSRAARHTQPVPPTDPRTYCGIACLSVRWPAEHLPSNMHSTRERMCRVLRAHSCKRPTQQPHLRATAARLLTTSTSHGHCCTCRWQQHVCKSNGIMHTRRQGQSASQN